MLADCVMVNIAGVGNMVYVKLTMHDKILLDNCMPAIPQQQTTGNKTPHWIRAIKLWWKRKSFNKQDWNKPLYFMKLCGVRTLSDCDLGSLKYKHKLQVSICTVTVPLHML